MKIEDINYSIPDELANKENFDIEKWRSENPMDYLKAMFLINKGINKNEIFKTIYRITRLYIPDRLFKYYSLTDNVVLNEQKLETIRQAKIFMSIAKDLNDPFDSKAYFYRPEELMKYERLAHNGGKLIDDFTSFSRIAALTANDMNNMPMWAHYSNNHRGFCVSYDMKDKRNIQLSGCTFPVQYINKRIDVTSLVDNQVKMLFTEMEKSKAKGIKEILINDLSLIFMMSFFCNIKHETWKYENEFRCTAGDIAKGMPYFPAYPNGIYIGMYCLPTYFKELVKIATELKIPIYRTAFNEYNMDFNLSIEKLN